MFEKVSRLVYHSVTLLLLALAFLQPALADAPTSSLPHWEYSYEPNVLPPQASPAWELVEPAVKAGMTSDSHLEAGALSMSLTGDKVERYYQSGMQAEEWVWRPDSGRGNTVELCARVTQAVPGVPYTFLLSLPGLGAQGRQSAILYCGRDKVVLGTKSVPLDLSRFHIFRITRDPATQNVALYIDNAATASIVMPLSGLATVTYESKQIIFGGTYSPMFQGTWELSYLRWTNGGAWKPEGSPVANSGAIFTPVVAAASVVPAAPKIVATPVVAARAPIDLSDADVKRVNDLFARFERFPQIAVPLVSAPPNIDGTVGPGEWKTAAAITGLVSIDTRHVEQKPSRLLLAQDAQNLYLAWQLDRPGGEAPLARTIGRVDTLWNKEDGLELMLSPDRQRRVVFSLFVNGASGYSDGFIVDGKSFDTSQHVNWIVKSRVTPRGIEGELSIAKTAFDKILQKANASLDTNGWGLDVMRVDLSPENTLADWSQMWNANNYNGNFLGRLDFRSAPVAVRLQALGALDEDRLGERGSIVNAAAQPLHAKLSYAVYRATRDVRAGKIYLFDTWDKVNKIRLTGSDVDEGAAVQLFLGENNWLKNLGRAYELVTGATHTLDVAPNSQTPFEIAINSPSGQFIVAAKLTDDSGQMLWAQTSPLEVKAPVDVEIEKRFLTAGGVVVRVDTGGSAKSNGSTVEGRLSDARGDLLTSWHSAISSRFVPVENFLDMKQQRPGNYVVSTRLLARDGTLLGHNRTAFSKPVAPAWWKNNIGYSNQVPAPFTVVHATPQSSSVWGRTYTWNPRSPFPQQITTQGHALLAAPIELTIASRGQTLAWKTVTWQLVAATPRSATYHCVQTAGDFRLHLTTTVDFDGLIHFTGKLNGGRDPIDSLKLRFPLRSAMVTHFHGAQWGTDLQNADGKYKAGSLDDFARDFADGATPFAALFWLGGQDGGLQWISQWDKGWSNPDRSKVMRVDSDATATTLEVSFVGQPTLLKEPLPIDFAINVSPVKDTSYYWSMGSVNGASNFLAPTTFDAKKSSVDLQVARQNGITQVMIGGWGFPFHADIWARDHNNPHFGDIVKSIHASGLKTFYYGCWGYDINGAEAHDFGRDMMKLPLQAAGPDTYWYNPEGPWVDFFMAGLQHTIQTYGVDGIYLDSMAPTNICGDPLLGQTYTDEKGRLHGRWPIWALRQWAMRMQNLIHITDHTGGIVYQHDSSAPNLAVVSLADVRCGGEDAPSRDTLRASWPLDAYFARNSTHAFGVPLETLWYNWWERPLKENNVLSVILLNGQMKSRTGGDLASYNLQPNYDVTTTPNIAILKLFQGFDIPHAQWHPYYAATNWVTPELKTLYASSYVHPGQRALVVVSNLDGTDVHTKVHFDLAAAGFAPGAVRVTDAYLKTDLPIVDDCVQLDIQKERYRLLLVEPRSTVRVPAVAH